jgi:hypothetical protein
MFETPAHYNRCSLLLLNMDTRREARWFSFRLAGSCGHCRGPFCMTTSDVACKPLDACESAGAGLSCCGSRLAIAVSLAGSLDSCCGEVMLVEGVGEVTAECRQCWRYLADPLIVMTFACHKHSSDRLMTAHWAHIYTLAVRGAEPDRLANRCWSFSYEC